VIIPGIIISALTFPGVIIHEFAHQLFCWLMRLPVYEVKYYQLKNPAGYVTHEPSRGPLGAFLVSVGPFIINTLIGALILFPVSIEANGLGIYSGIRAGNIAIESIQFFPIKLVAYWLGISILMHAFPSVGDAHTLISSILKNKDVNIIIRGLTAPVIGLIFLGAVGSMVWLDLGYALGIAFLLPRIAALFM
jgi:hypothetical protein